MNADRLFQTFVDNNSDNMALLGSFGMDDFRKIIDKNNRADELANIAMDELR